MTKEKKEPIVSKAKKDVSFNSEELKENLAKLSKWLRLLWIIAFSFVYYVAIGILLLIIVTQFLFSLFTNSPNENIFKVSNGLFVKREKRN
jgi:uncharacterized protein YqhQ